MKSTAAIVVDGVLRKHVGGTPISAGIALYHALCSAFNVVLIIDGGMGDSQELEHFLDTEQLVTHGMVAYGIRPGLDPGPTRVLQAGRLRQAGYALEFIVEPDPAVARDLFREGINVLHFMHARYARPDWRPDYQSSQPTWDTLVAEEAKAAKLRAEDSRIGSVE